jgi:hydroxymethylglutaryl-CoA reductase (NADPH)
MMSLNGNHFLTSALKKPSDASGAVTPNTQAIAASQVVLDAVEQVGASIVRDYAIEVLVLCVGAASGVGGLKEFCALAAIILTMDCIALWTFYVGVLAVMVEVSQTVRP